MMAGNMMMTVHWNSELEKREKKNGYFSFLFQLSRLSAGTNRKIAVRNNWFNAFYFPPRACSRNMMVKINWEYHIVFEKNISSSSIIFPLYRRVTWYLNKKYKRIIYTRFLNAFQTIVTISFIVSYNSSNCDVAILSACINAFATLQLSRLSRNGRIMA